MKRLVNKNFKLFCRSFQLPTWAEELQKSNKLRDYDVNWFVPPKEYIYEFDNDVWEHLDLPETHKEALIGNKKKYICLGEGLGFPDFQDNQCRYHPLNPSFIHLDPESETPKLLLQLTKDFPPLLWIPIKPGIDILQRCFKEYIDIETTSVGRNVQEFDKMLTVCDDKDLEKRRDQFLKYIDETDPDSIKMEHPNTVHLYMGTIEDEQLLERSLMNNPFIFNLPLIRGSTNKRSDKVITTSIFRTIISRSIISIDVRKDLFMEFEHGRQIPCFARINYPDNERMSYPCAKRMNKVFGTNYPENMPVDVIAALIGNAMRGFTSIREEIKQSNDKYAPYQIAYLAILKDPDFGNIFERFYQNSNTLMRIACLKGAAELGLKEKVDKMVQVEEDPEVLSLLEKVIQKFNKK